MAASNGNISSTNVTSSLAEDVETDRMISAERHLVRTLSTRRSRKAATYKCQSVAGSAFSRSFPFDTVDVQSTAFQKTVDNGVRCMSINGSDRHLNDIDLGSEDTWRQHDDVQRLDIEDAGERLLAAIGSHAHLMTSLETLSVTWSPTKTIHSSWSSAMSPFCRLKSLSMTRNQLRSIDGVESMGCFQLELLDVSGNMIDALPKNIGRTLTHLTTLNVAGNSLRTLPESMGRLVSLRSLDCSRNRITRLPNVICSLTELICLDASGNQLTSVPDDIGKLVKLEDLRLSANRLTTVPNSFAHLSKLRSLLIAHNRLVHIPIQMSALPCLERLNAASNRLVSIDCALPVVRSLILDDNQLTSVPRGVCFSPMLEVLSLERNRISDVSTDIGRLAELRTLKLAGNDNVSTVPESALGGLVRLRHIGLRSTRVRSLPDSLTELRRLTLVDLDRPTVDGEVDDVADGEMSANSSGDGN